ncbi:MAG: hypothetical protein HOM96_04320 [Rickettsiales bacterium]|nr:hypothetical protein [Rickettsiales bacterium]
MEVYSKQLVNKGDSVDQVSQLVISGKEIKYNLMKTDIYNYSITDLINDRSILFNAKQIEKLNKVLTAIILGELIDEDEIFDQEDESAELQEVVTFRSMRFYLDSIMYSNKDNWIIWVNGKKYDQDNPGNEEFQIEDVYRNRVKLQWVTGYNKFVYILKQSIANNNIPESIKVRIVDDIASVSFYLEINQTFLLSKEVTITEGKL